MDYDLDMVFPVHALKNKVLLKTPCGLLHSINPLSSHLAFQASLSSATCSSSSTWGGGGARFKKNNQAVYPEVSYSWMCSGSLSRGGSERPPDQMPPDHS